MKLSHFAIALSSLTLFALPCISFAGTSGSLALSGTVAANNDIEITANGTNNTAINITAGSTALNVASAQETSNDSNGYKITIQSANNGELELGGTSTAQETAYQVSYDGNSYVTPTTTATAIKSVSSLTALTVHNSAILVTTTPYANAVAGTYSDTLTLAIVAN